MLKKPQISWLDTACLAEEDAYRRAYERVGKIRREKADRCRLVADKRLSVGAGLLLAQALEKLGISADAVVYPRDQKPYLPKEYGVQFSLSHSGSLAVCALYEQEIGVDAERIRPVSLAFPKRVLTPREQQALRHAKNPELSFFRLWTAKESYLKYTGEGLRLSPRLLEVDLPTKTLYRDGQKMPVVLEDYSKEGYCITLCYSESE